MGIDWKKVVTDSILQHMGEGVMVLSAEGEIVGGNAAASSIMGIDLGEGNLTLARIVLEEEGNDAFLQVLLDSVYEGTAIRDRFLDYVRPDGSTRFLAVTASHLRNETGKIEGAFLVLRDATEMEKLKASECALNDELKAALRQADENGKALEASLQQGQKIRNWLTAAILILFLGLGIYYWVGSPSTFGSGALTAARSGDSGQQNSMIVNPRPVTRSISLSGIVAPLEEVILAAPFQAKVERKLFFYGDRVERDQLLLVLDTADMAAKVRDARAAYIKAKKKSLELEGWDRTPDVAKAKRALSQAKSQLRKAQDKVLEDKTLYEQGIIPRSEYDSSVEDVQDKKMQYVASEESLQSTLDKGDDEYREIAQMEMENAEAKMKAAEEKLAQTEIRAPVSGIAIRPSSKDKDANNVTAGMSVNEGQALLSVGSLEGLSITTEVDELDINNLEKGQPVLVSGDAFPGIQLKGRISQISSQANDGQVPTFTTTIRLRDLPDDVEKTVRLGMTANMQVETYSNPEALLVPLTAVHRAGEGSMVRVVEGDGNVAETAVETGYTTLTEVEIVSGLKPGATILIGPAQ
ncbi:MULTISPECIES: efflux RND transporter periplasmic adaptor subunit [unclassified Pseudodesulfovibrio]|uniref:efflux RND transporter periplasmic adaptor subunit n=1 Tax=unclassified Pseudodesulfovibrio TaxID=2661612 RepID=UPI0013E28A2E|nr:MULTISPECIES: efflux RND transporter periplasmic adaptor subunit [unclassified Pseudodesulfovibrio]MCJ2165251.1 efflux RND transporter periplasmic adaptor subunit [Pseudodesulfovibrio sp. S3-i]